MSLHSMSINGVTWYNLEKIEKEILLELQEKFEFHDLDIEDCLSHNERPKIEEYPDYLFCVIHVPTKTDNRVTKDEVNIFLGRDFIITISEGKGETIQQLWTILEQAKDKREEYFEGGTGFFLYKLLDLLFDKGFPLTEWMMKELRNIEEELIEKEDTKKNILRDILVLKRNIITMRSILSPQRSVIALLQHKNKQFVQEDLEIYFDDVLDAIERQWSLLDTAKEMSDALQSTHESWLGHRTNEVIRLLTMFSVAMVPLTFLTGLYGMNIDLPFADSQHAFSYLLLSMMTVMSALLGYFAWRKWL